MMVTDRMRNFVNGIQVKFSAPVEWMLKEPRPSL